MNSRSSCLHPTAAQKLLRVMGRIPLPRLKGMYGRLGVLRETKPRMFECEFDGFRYRGRLDQQIDKHVWFFGAYSPAELAFLDHSASILRRERHDVSFIDIGANVGQHTLFMSRRVATVLAFEPGDEAAAQLEGNLQLNGIENVKLVRVALGSKTGTAELGSGFPGNNGSRSLHWSLDASKNITVPVRRGDDEFQQHGISRVDIIKMDVEGHEREVLTGIRQTLWRDRPIVLFELVGVDVKGGFSSERELRACLYPDHVLYTLSGDERARLSPFSWSCEEAVCVPAEIAVHFRALTR